MATPRIPERTRVQRVRYTAETLGWRRAVHETVKWRWPYEPEADNRLADHPRHRYVRRRAERRAGHHRDGAAPRSDPLPAVAGAGDDVDVGPRRRGRLVADLRGHRLREGTGAADRRSATDPARARDRDLAR